MEAMNNVHRFWILIDVGKTTPSMKIFFNNSSWTLFSTTMMKAQIQEFISNEVMGIKTNKTFGIVSSFVKKKISLSLIVSHVLLLCNPIETIYSEDWVGSWK